VVGEAKEGRGGKGQVPRKKKTNLKSKKIFSSKQKINKNIINHI
jgi:hypothetical protein